MNKYLLALALLSGMVLNASAQTDGVAIDYSGSPVREPKAIMQLNSTVQGFIIPRMTAAQRAAIAPPGTAEGMTVYQTDAPEGYYFWDGAVWMQLANATGGAGYIQNQVAADQAAGFRITGNGLFNGGSVGIGDVTPNSLFTVGSNSEFQVNSQGFIPTIQGTSPTNGAIRLTGPMLLNSLAGNAVAINFDNGVGVGSFQTFRIGDGASNDVFYVLNSGSFYTAGSATINTNAIVGGAVSAGSIVNSNVGYRISSGANSGEYLRGNGTNFVSSVIQAADVPTLNQNTTGTSSGFTGNLAGDVAGPQGTTVIQDNSVDGTDIALGSDAQGDIMYYDATNNWVRLPAGTSGNFLKTQGAGANPIWAADNNSGGTVTSVSTASANNGVTATWSMASPTPALTIGLGAITPSSVAAVGTVTGSNLSGTNTGDQTNISGNAGTVTNGFYTTSFLAGDITGNPGSNAIAAGVIVNADVNAAAAIAYSKLNLAASIVTGDIVDNTVTGTDVTESTLVMTGLIDDDDLQAAAVDGGLAGEIADGTVDANDLASSGVTAGSYTLSSITVDADGRITAASSGSGGTGTVTSVSTAAANNGVTATWSMASPTPALTIGLGAITPSSVAAVGTVTGSNLSGTNTGDQTNISGNAGTVTNGFYTTSFLAGDITGNPGSNAIAAGVIVNADVNAAAAIAYSKLNLAASIVTGDIVDNTVTGTDVTELTLVMTGLIDDDDLQAAAVDGGLAGEIADGTVDANDLASTTVIAGSYTTANITVDADGRITASSNGTVALSGGTTNGVTYWTSTTAVGATAVGATNTVLHGNTGAAPTFSAVVSADITDGTITGADILDGTVASADITDGTVTSTDILDATIANADIANATIVLTTKVTGVLPIANGGTNGTAVPTAGGVPYGTGTAYAFTAAGTSGQVLKSNGAGAPTWGADGFTQLTTRTIATTTAVTLTATDQLIYTTGLGLNTVAIVYLLQTAMLV